MYKRQGEGLRGIMKDDYDNRLDQLEAKFEKDKEAIENSSLSKDVKKDKVRSLKNQYRQITLPPLHQLLSSQSHCRIPQEKRLVNEP